MGAATSPRELGFPIFDADNHYYEAEDAFTRHLDRRYARRGIRWVTVDGKRRLLAGGRLWRFIPNPTWDPIARPGALDAYFRGRHGKGADVRELFGDLDRLADHPEYQRRDARLAVMDRQGMEGCFMFPTLGVGVEEALWRDPEALVATFRAFNDWLAEDWGYAYRDRIFAAPMLTLVDPVAAVAELERVLEAGARIVCLRAAPVMTPAGGRSPGDPVYDPFWATVAEAGAVVGFHSGDAGYARYAADWGASEEFEAFRQDPFRTIVTDSRPIFDTMAALVCHGVFHRHPGVRVAVIESGSGWVGELAKRFRKVYRQMPHLFPEDPMETFRRHVWISPFYEDDIRALSGTIGVDHVLMGSDWPHAEGLAEPAAYVDDLAGFTDDEIRSVMHDNAAGLVRPAA